MCAEMRLDGAGVGPVVRPCIVAHVECDESMPT
jgi:hypothetical protein